MDDNYKSVILDFTNKEIRMVAFAKTREEAERIERQLGLTIYFPSEIANFGDDESIYVLLGY